MDFLQVKSEKTFKKLSLELFDFHYNENDNYREFCDNIKLNNGEIDSIENKIKTIKEVDGEINRSIIKSINNFKYSSCCLIDA